MKKITPLAEVAHLEMLCNLLECLLIPKNVPSDCPKEWFEIYFVFACIWAFGSTMFQDQIVDYRMEFTKWWTNEFKVVKIPTQGSVFDYVIDDETKKFIPWSTLTRSYELDYDIPLQSTLVDTAETTRLRYFMDLMLEKKLPIMLVGSAGSGKSVIIADKLSSLSENYMVTNVPFNFYTTSEMLQKVLEKPLEKKAGRNYGPPGTKTMIYFVDDMNMPEALLFSIPECVPTVPSLLRLWIHEAQRVYRDKLVDVEDVAIFNKLQEDVARTACEEAKPEELFKTPLIYCHFAEGIGETKYLPVHTWPQLSKLLNEAQSQYNDLVGALNLVLFEDAMEHVCRINRILECPRGNALLIGVGGSGKQSLSRLAAFISSLEVFQLQLRKGYGLNDLRADINVLYMKAGLKNTGVMYLMSDAQVADEKFLVVINDLLASGEIPELFQDDEIENIVNNIRNEVKAAGINDTKENCWKFFIQRVRGLMKVVLCFSPVGSTLRVRARKFPAVVNCTSLDWFHAWPQVALESVSGRFVEEIPTLPEHLRRSVSLFMAHVHTTVDEMSGLYLQNERRYNYTTPKTFLEQINLYGKLLNSKTEDLERRIVRLENGLEKLASAGTQVEGLKVKLAEQEVVVAEKNEAADKLIQVVGKETEIVSKEKEFVAEEEGKVRVIEEDVTAKQKICEADLKKAEPALLAAMEALNTLNKNNLTELKSFGSPPAAVVNVTAAVLVLFSQKGKIPKERGWKECKIMMAKVDAFLDNLINYKKENIPPDVVKETKKYIADPEFDPDKIISKSQAAAGLCAWVINIIKFFEVYEVVEPKRQALAQANDDLAAARAKLETLTSRIRELEHKLGLLTADFEAAVAAKVRCQQEADATALTIDLANRLVNGLASENIRWRNSVADLKTSGITLPGDVLLVTAFISYVGCFTRQYRLDLLNNKWKPFFQTLKEPIPLTEGMDPLSMLTDDAQIAKWNNEGLPADRMSSENATILTNSDRWPLMIDPQLQGIKWIKQRYGKDLKVVRLGHKNYLDVIENSITNGFIVLIENIGESVDAVLDPVLGRNLVRKGRAIKMGDKEIDYNPDFRLILHTKLANPHYKPEMQAQTTLINFTVTRDGLEEQLLGEVVKAERPDLERLKSNLTKQQNIFKITLAELEDDLLARLAAAGEDILSDKNLVINLETTKKTSAEIEVKVIEAKQTAIELDQAREEYRPAATRGSLLYFILNELNKINPIYQFSLKAFNVVFKNALSTAEAAERLVDRLPNLLDSITFCVFMYTNRGLFERDKLIFMSQMTIQILVHKKEIPPSELDFLLRFPITPSGESPVDFLTSLSWGGIKTLVTIEDFHNLDRDIEGSAKTWKKFVDSECPEKEKFPQEWKNKTSFQKLCMMRALRADRMTYAIKGFIEEKLGTKFTEARTPEFAKSFQETSSSTPVFFILSPGVDPLKDVEKLGKKLGFTFDRRNFHNVSLGQGQEPVAEDSMDVASKKGHWVILQNIHLVAKWLPTLEKKMEQCSLKAHKKYRLYLSAEPAGDPSAHVIPQGILESSIKITNEPPTGMLANIHKALDNFNQDTLEMCSKEAEFKAILFSLCYFHAVIAERRKFGPQGDLTISVHVLYNYLEASSTVPWEDLRYLFGEIMYGGHITDDWDRRLCRTYLAEYMSPTLLDGDLLLAPGFPAPPNIDYVGYHMYVDGKLPPESPYLYGLHPNAEIGFLTTTSETLFRTLFELQPRDAGAGAGGMESKDDKIRSLLEEYLDRIPELFNMVDIMARTEERTPYIIVAFQECERMNILVREISRTLHELFLGLKGELTITPEMEGLQESLFIDAVPDSWSSKAYPSMFTLGPWFADLQTRYRELENWSGDFNLPSSVWLGGFFNPQSFLTAIMQSTARKNEWPLDKMCLYCDVTKKFKEDITAAPREGAFINGLFMEGARWDTKLGSIAESKLKELYPLVPVIFIKAITQDKQDLKNMYQCPVYKTKTRGPTYVWTFNLKTKERESKWTLAGVAILLQV
ncbi:Putative dynein heavy chain [Gryllus bimaculatus]|nr:Putative dynein heavy chain [Gryllus bimaculatus]